ncbi:MAG: hypothetical protein ACYTG6_18005, partial [Planctomycetota bacterium]
MRRLALLVVVTALLLSLTGPARADEDDETGRIDRLAERVQTLLDLVTRLRQEVADLGARVTQLEAARADAAKPDPPQEPERPPEPDRTGKIAVPINPRLIKAYTRVTRDHLLLPTGTQLSLIYLDPNQVTDVMMTSVRDVFGRVLRYDKLPGYVFTEADFYPRGTRPGPMAGVPPGQRAVWLEVTDVPALRSLQQFDRFDLLTTVAVEVEDARDEPAPGEPPSRVRRRRAEVRVIVRDGLIVEPATPRDPAATPPSLLSLVLGTRPDRTIETVVIAVDPDEVAAVYLALALGARLEVALRSGQAAEGDVPAEAVPNLGWELVVEPGLIEASPLAGHPDRNPPEAVGVYVLDRDASVEATAAELSAGTNAPEEVHALREVAEDFFAAVEMTVELEPDGTFAGRYDTALLHAPHTIGGTWLLVGEQLILVTTHEDGQEQGAPADPITGTWQDGRITVHRRDDGFVLVLV